MKLNDQRELRRWREGIAAAALLLALLWPTLADRTIAGAAPSVQAAPPATTAGPLPPIAAAEAAQPLVPQIWFAPLDPLVRPEVGYGGSGDFMKLFEADAPWATAASHIQVFKLYPQFMRRGSDSELAILFKWLDQHKIALAIEVGLIHPRPNCARTEGFDADQKAMAERVRRLGGNLQYVTADEPLYFGHSHKQGDQQRPACQIPIPEVADDAAASARDFQAIFPNVRFVDGEPISNFKEANWVGELGDFLNAFRQAYGQPFAAVHLDIAWWEASWKERAMEVTKYLRGIGEPIGVIYNGNPGDKSDQAWLDSAREHYRTYEALVGSPPNQAIFQSWARNPTRLLPETDPAAFTSMVVDYERSHRPKSP